jgi:hypothetical protein
MEASMRVHCRVSLVASIRALIYVIFGGIHALILLRKRGVVTPLSRVAEPGPDPHYYYPWTLTMEAWRAFRLVVADSHHSEEEPDPDLH